MEEIPISEFKTNCSALLEQVRGTPIRIIRHGKPVADIVPPSVVIQDRSAWIESMKGSVKIFGDIVSPANEQSEWESLSD